MATAHLVHEATYTTHAQYPGYLEPMGTVAMVDGDGRRCHSAWLSSDGAALVLRPRDATDERLAGVDGRERLVDVLGAEHFAAHADVEAVLYPGLPDFRGHAIARRQMRGGFGGMLSLRVKPNAQGGEAAAVAVAAHTQLWKRATSLGGTESLIEHRASVEGAGTPAPADLLRLSVGIEHVDDLIADLEQAVVQAGETAVREYKKGQEVEAIVLAVDVERERISLGVKQLEQDPFQNWLAGHEKGAVVKGVVKEVDAKGAIITLADSVEGYLRASEIMRDRVEDAFDVTIGEGAPALLLRSPALIASRSASVRAAVLQAIRSASA